MISAALPTSHQIDRRALVERHKVVLDHFDGEIPLQVGNGEFAFGMDVTGLQTFAPFNTMSQWGWHSSPLPPGVHISDFKGQVWDTHGRPVRYPMPDPEHPEISAWLAANPHRINLGRIGLILFKKDGTEATAADLETPHQVLDLWTGVVKSSFEIEGEPVMVTTAAHPSFDTVAAKVESPLIKEGRLKVFLTCPGDDPAQFANFVGDWAHPAKLGLIGRPTTTFASFIRILGSEQYRIFLNWTNGTIGLPPHETSANPEILKAEYGSGKKWLDVTDELQRAVSNGKLVVRVGNNLGPDPNVGVGKVLKATYRIGDKTSTVEIPENQELFIDARPHRDQVILTPDSSSFSFSCTFAPGWKGTMAPSSAAVFKASRSHWPQFWKSGGAIDLSGSTDPRWKELERRIVLSQYLMAVNEAGEYPPQESGLVNNGWFGRWHMEMVWWHAAHWALWNRWSEVNRSLTIYKKLLPTARKLAKSEGYLGARWPKCIGPNLREWPHEIHALLIWQQPHPIFFAELDYRAHPTKKTLLKWAPIVEATGDFLASYAFYDKETKRYNLGPPLQVVSENLDARQAMNPTFELGYWRFGLRVAQLWRKRLGLPVRPNWAKVLKGLAPLPVENGVYVLDEGIKDMWTKFNFEHPALTGVFGMLPGDGVNRQTMLRTLDKVVSTWDFNRTWGWDFPMLAMCAARLGEPDRAIDFLMTKAPGFQFYEQGLATGGPFPYFPSNGGLLYAIAMMAKGWDGAPNRPAPGFPTDGRWVVKYEDLSPAP